MKLKDMLYALWQKLGVLKINRYINESKSSPSITIAPGGRSTTVIDVSKSGYTPIGIVGIYIPDTDAFSVNEFYFGTETTAVVVLSNTYTESKTSVVKANILYRKNVVGV